MSKKTIPGPVEGPLSDNERLKRESNFLRGTIAEDLQDPLTGGFNGDNFQLIRFHGMYQQDDRDIRPERAAQKLEPLHNVMLRARLPGGIITPAQWQVIDKFAEEHSLYGSIRLTTRQTFQFHGVLKRDIKLMHQTLNSTGIDSIATAGDVNRNVLCTSNPVESELHQEAYEWAKKISEHLLPKTRAYVEIWLDGEKLGGDEEPILGSTYLPRKFKTTVVIPPHNDVDIHANDLNFVAISDHGKLVGFNVLVGGGLAMTHGDTSTYPRKASDFGFVPLSHVLEVAAAVVSTQRDWATGSTARTPRPSTPWSALASRLSRPRWRAAPASSSGRFAPMSSPAVAIASAGWRGSTASTTSPCSSRMAACWTSRASPSRPACWRSPRCIRVTSA